MLLAGFSFFIVKERGKSEAARKQSDGLLLNILPEEVAEELKSTGTTTAKHYDNVTVLFTDFVNFTQAGENMSPQNLIDELHTCFKAFDEITSKYNIEKIKTIGDAYLAVCGLPTADHKHAENVVSAATEINSFMANRLAHMGSERTFAVRIGIHSGSVVAGIVGVKKFAYDIWGDTVNTAARMEQHGEAGRINISETTYELVKNKFPCEYRGEVEAKGKGVMKMYFMG
jgi:class 3 adenylate cyclase